MSFFKRKEKNLIPPVPEPTSARDDLSRSRGSNNPSPLPAHRSYAATYIPSRDGDLYGTGSKSAAPSPAPPGDYGNGNAGRYTSSYSKQNAVGDVYSRGQANIDQDRGELFAGYKPEKSSGRFFADGTASRGADGEPGEVEGQGEDEDVEGIKQQLRFTKQESVNSTRNALRLAREAEETARNTLTKLGDQSEKLASTERHLDVAKGHSQRAEDKTDELKQLNRSIFRPVITFNKEAKRAAQEAKIQQRYDEEREEREKAMLDIRETQNRLGRAATYGQRDDDGTGSGRMRTVAEQNIRKEQRKRYQFESTASDDEMEDELDDNLNEISDMTKRLKALGTAMGEELDNQNSRIGRITEKTDGLDNRLFHNTQRLNRIR